ncbi:MAG: hypothetical protein ACPIA7_01255 [Akkermansiaceae bacterium]
MLDLNRLENVKQRGNKVTSACPACREAGRDRKGTHLFYNTDTEKFGCAAHQGDNAHRQAIWAYAGVLTELTDEQKAEWKKRKDEENARQCKQLLNKVKEKQIMRKIPQFLSPYIIDDWLLDFLDRSPIRFRDRESLRHEFLLRLFYMDDIIWMGSDKKQSGKPHHAKHFRTVRDWLKLKTLPPLMASGVFHEGSISRCKASVNISPYIVIECDEIIGREPKTEAEKAENKKLSSALIAYAQDRLGLILRAVIDTGNKSLHAWFDRPSQADFEALSNKAEALCIDKGVLDNCSHSPLRLSGCLHNKSNKEALLIYLNPITP